MDGASALSCVLDVAVLVVREYKHTGAQLVLPLQGALGNPSSGSKVIIQGDYHLGTYKKQAFVV